MSDIEFNPNLDKITERETVYDFFDRLTVGRDTSVDINNTAITLHSNDNIKNILAKLLYFALPEQFPYIISNIKTTFINVNANSLDIKFHIPKNSNIIAIYSDKTGDDLIDIFEENIEYEDENNKEYIMKIDCGYINNDVIKIYFT